MPMKSHLLQERKRKGWLAVKAFSDLRELLEVAM